MIVELVLLLNLVLVSWHLFLVVFLVSFVFWLQAIDCIHLVLLFSSSKVLIERILPFNLSYVTVISGLGFSQPSPSKNEI